MDNKGGEGVSSFSVEFFCLTMQKTFAGEPFCAVFKKVSGSEKLYELERGVSIFSVKIFLSRNAENFRN